MPLHVTSGGSTPGMDERQLHLASGLRNISMAPVISTNLTGIVGRTSIGSADGSIIGAWPQFGLKALDAVGPNTWSMHLPVPMTPTVAVYAVPAVAFGTVSFRIRMRGLDQFGNVVEEVTPWIDKVQTTSSQMILCHMSKVFAAVYDCHVMTNGISATNGSAVSIGWSTVIDPTRVAAAALSISTFTAIWTIVNAAATATSIDLAGTWANWGIGIPAQVAPYGPSIPHATPEIIGATGTILREKTTPTSLMVTARIPGRGQTVAGAIPATAMCVGRSVSGWQGTAHKIGFSSTDSFTTKVSGLELGGSSSRASQRPALEAQIGEDDLMFNVALRTTIGSRRGSNATSSYRN